MSWSKVRGHATQIATLAQTMRSGRLAHAYLFSGPPGVGKRVVAIELAKALLCESPASDGTDACDKCAACHLVDAGTHPDLISVSRPPQAHDLSIEVMRELSERLALKPARGRRRIAVVDDADDFNETSANSFLKTLEEPPAGSLLILIGTNPDLQLPTIRSRCQQVRFDPLSVDVMTNLLREQGVEDERLVKRLVRIADGSPGLAMSLATEDLWDFRKAFVTEAAQTKPDGPTLAKQWMKLTETAGKDSAAQRQRAGLILRLIIDAYRQALTIDDAEDADEEEVPRLQALLNRFGPDGLIDRLDRCLDAETHLDRKVQLILLVEAIVDALTQDNGVVAFRPAWQL
jgi:DNA polymerase-3 subunit delta'